MNNLQWLQEWYLSNCDGEWEHGFGIKIESSDNPGWIVEISTINTTLEGVVLPYELIELSSSDWFGVELQDILFRGVGDASKLDFLISKFKELLADPPVVI